MSDKILDKLTRAIGDIKPSEAIAAVKEAIDAEIPPSEIMSGGISRGLEIVGSLYEKKYYFEAELIAAGTVVREILELITPLVVKERLEKNTKPLGRAVVGTVLGDIHDIGKNIFVAYAVAEGFDVCDLGVDVPAETFIKKVKETNANLVGMSALLTTTVPYIKTVIDALRESGLRENVLVIVGGRAVTLKLAREIGADAYSESAIEGAQLARRLLREKETASRQS